MPIDIPLVQVTASTKEAKEAFKALGQALSEAATLMPSDDYHLTNESKSAKIEEVQKFHHHGVTMDTQIETPAHFKSRPLVVPVDFSTMDARTVFSNVACEVDGSYADERRSPEGDALQFYLLNHAASAVLQKYSDDDVMSDADQALLREYHRYLGGIAYRMCTYLILICLREARHIKGVGHDWNLIFGSDAYHWYRTRVQGSDQATLAYKKVPKNVTVGVITRMLAAQYFWGAYGDQFGGPKWGEVALTLSKFVHGEISAEVMVDTAWTLAHNTGPIFNKGLIFQPQDTGELLHVLNVQRAGLIPEYADSLTSSRLLSLCQGLEKQRADLCQTLVCVKAAVPDLFGDKFDASKIRSIKGSPLYSGLDFSFGFKVPAGNEHLASPAVAERVKSYYQGKMPAPNPENVVHGGLKPSPKTPEPTPTPTPELSGVDHASEGNESSPVMTVTVMDVLQKKKRETNAA